VAIPAAVASLLVASALGDHYFRDEFYYLACTHRMDWGYVDQPPLSIGVLWLVRQAAGESLLTLRVATALIAAASVALTGSIARRLGATTLGASLAMLAAGLAPALLAAGSFYSMNVLDVLFWTMAARVFMAVLDRPTLGRWILFGIVLGLALENKISVLWLGGGLAAGLVLTSARRHLLTPGPWIAGLVAAVLFAPHVAWQVAHGWPTLEFIRNASAQKMQANSPIGFLIDQVMNMNPLLLPLWLTGLMFLLFARNGAPYRALGISFLAVASILVLNRTSRSGYLSPAYPMLFAAGGVVAERVLRWRALQVLALLAVVGACALSAPLALPLLSVDRYVQYSRALGIAPSTEEKKDLGRLPQFFADRQGWDRFVDQVAAAFDTLTPDERRTAAVLVGNYGEAGAIELLGRSRGLVAISGHNNYWLWGPQGRTGDVLLVISRSRERQAQRFTSVTDAGEIDCGDCMPYENHLRIFVGRGMRPPSLPARWAEFKHYE